jgi:hypothetical protein
MRAQDRRELAMLRRAQAYHASSAFGPAFVAPQTVYYAPARYYPQQQPYRAYRAVPVRYEVAEPFYPAAPYQGSNGFDDGGLFGGGLGSILTAILPLVLGEVVGGDLGGLAGQSLGAPAGYGFDGAAPVSYAGLDPVYHDAYAAPSIGYGDYAYDDYSYADGFDPAPAMGGDGALLGGIGSMFGSGLLGNSFDGLGGNLLGSGLGGFGSQPGYGFDGGYGIDPETLIAQAVVPGLLG